MKRLLAVLLFLVLLLGAVSCKEELPAEEDSSFTVTFVTTTLPYEAAAPERVTVKKGESTSRPALDAQATAGYVVIWTKDSTKKTPYDFSAAVEEDIVLYAVEVPREYTVTYLMEKGKNSANNPTTFTMATETIVLKEPTMPFGYRFIKWAYYDDPDSVVDVIEKGTEGDVVLRAVYAPVEYTVTYLEAGEENPNPPTYVFGSTLSLESPLKEGFVFRGFTIAGDVDKTPVTTLTAEFVVAHRTALFYENGTICLVANWEVKE